MTTRLWFFALVLLSALNCSAFERPTESQRAEALGPLDNESATLQRLLTTDDFAPIRLPAAGDWLAVHREQGQSFAAYRESGANQPNASRRIIYLLPLGDFPADASPPFEDMRAYAEIYFQCEVKILPAVPVAADRFKPRVNEYTHRRQLLTTAIMDYLKTQLPSDAYCLLGLTMEDLYPSPSWNYVFGQASLRERIGVYSFARYDPAFFGEKTSTDNGKLVLQRGCKVLAHETAHMFGLHHCIYYACVLNGANSLEESDAQPDHLCPICLRKLHDSVQFDAVNRYAELARFYRQHGWNNAARWTERQLAKAAPR